MDDLAALHPHGLFLRGEALELGYKDRDLVVARAAGVIQRVRHGAYIAAPTWQAASPEEQFRLRGQAVMLSHGETIALSHTSGAAALGLRLWDADFTRVHVTRLDKGSARCHQDVVYHTARWTPDDIIAVEETLVLSPARSALGAAGLQRVEGGLVVLDSVLDLDLASPDELRAAYELIKGGPRTASLQITMRLVEPGSQSAGESRARYLCFSQHLPKPMLQFAVYDGAELVGITDFAWPDHRLLGEFDGRIKYGRLLKPGETAQEAVYREKLREDALREITGYGLIRLTWADLARPTVTGARIRSKLWTPAAA